jgi:hypothetical protein
MDIQNQINGVKTLLDQAETDYQHSMAAGNWEACALHKNRVSSYRREIGKLVKQKLARN